MAKALKLLFTSSFSFTIKLKVFKVLYFWYNYFGPAFSKLFKVLKIQLFKINWARLFSCTTLVRKPVAAEVTVYGSERRTSYVFT